VNADLPIPARPIWGRLSAFCAALAVVSPVAIALLFVGTEQARPEPQTSGPQAQAEAWGWLGRLLVTFVAAVAAAGLASAAGVIAGVLAIARAERPLWPAWFGLCICSPIALLLLIGVIQTYQ
jgi:hypothetical protein